MTLRISALGVKAVGSLAIQAPSVQISALGVKVVGSAPADALQISALGVKVIGAAPALLDAQLFISAMGVKVVGQAAPPPTIQPLPITPGDLVRAFFEPNWREPVQLVQSWGTAISTSDAGHEDRRGLYGRPRLGSRALHTSFDATASMSLMLLGARRARHRGPWPVWADASCLTSPLSDIGTTVFADVSSRLWVRGMRVVFWDDGMQLPLYATVASIVWPDRFVITAALGTPLNEGALVIPCIDSEISPVQDFDARSDAIFEGMVEAIEVAGPNTLTSSAELPGFAFRQFNGDDIFPLELNWRTDPSEGVESGIIDILNRGTIPRIQAMRTRLQGNLDQLTREVTWTVRQFFDRQRGQVRRFWIAHTLANGFEVISHGASLRIKALGDIEIAREYFTGIAMRLFDGSIHVTNITGIDQGISDDWFINLGFVDPAIIPSIDTYSLASLVRFTSDELEGLWTNIGGVCSMQLEVISVRNDKTDRDMLLVGVSR